MPDPFATLIAESRLPAPRTRRALRLAVGIGTGELAAQLGCHRTTISRYERERGARDPRGSIRARYSAFLSAAQVALRD